MRGKKTSYGFHRYNQYDVLRVSWTVWAILIFLARHFLALFISGVSHGRGGGGTGIPALAQLVNPIYLPSDLPSLLMFYAAGARMPQTGRAVRWMWTHGRGFIVAAAVLFFALAGYDIWTEGRTIGTAEYVETAIYAVILIYVLTSRYVKDLFAQFPAPKERASGAT